MVLKVTEWDPEIWDGGIDWKHLGIFSPPVFLSSPGQQEQVPLSEQRGSFCLENPMDRGAWQTAVHRVTQSQTRLKDLVHGLCMDHGSQLVKWDNYNGKA